MAEYDNTNSGVVFPNDRKQKSSHPDFKGQCTIKTPDGELVEYWVSGWEKEGRKGPSRSRKRRRRTLKSAPCRRKQACLAISRLRLRLHQRLLSLNLMTMCPSDFDWSFNDLR